MSRGNTARRSAKPADTLFRDDEPCVDGMKPSASGLRAAVRRWRGPTHRHPTQQAQPWASANYASPVLNDTFLDLDD